MENITGTLRGVKVASGLAAYCLKHSLDLLLKWWTVIRLADPEGQGHSGIPDIKQIADELGVRGRLRDILDQGEGIFWVRSRDRQRVSYRGLERLCRELEVIPGGWYQIPPEALSSNAKWRAHLHAAWHSHHGQTPISRDAVEDDTGTSKRSQRRYEKSTGIQVRPNIKRLSPKDPVDNKRRWRDAQDGNVYERMPNSYISRLPKLPRGKTSRVHASDTGNSDTGHSDGERLYWQPQGKARGFFNKMQKALHERGSLLTTWGELHPKGLVWEEAFLV